MTGHDHRAAPPQVPAPTRVEQCEEADHDRYIAGREHVERRRQMRGLLLLVVIAVALSVWRAGVGRVFPHGWWRLW